MKIKVIYISSVVISLLFLIKSACMTVLLKQNQNTYYEFAKVSHQETIADFYKKQCGFCHNQEESIGPDMKKIKAVYIEKFKTKEAFVDAIYKFVKNPNKKNAIYKEGIDKFMDMPKMPFKDKEIKEVAAYIYSTDNL
jgi:cytochrome c551/c552